MPANTFELKVGLLGHVSVGKTTGLNALLQGKFSEVSMKRTTAGINRFRLSSRKQPAIDAVEEIDRKKGRHHSAPDTLNEITEDNAKLRQSNMVQEKVFDIELNEPLLNDIREDTRLSIVDIPGINEAGASNAYLNFVEKTWDTYDAMIVVMVSHLCWSSE